MTDPPTEPRADDPAALVASAREQHRCRYVQAGHESTYPGVCINIGCHQPRPCVPARMAEALDKALRRDVVVTANHPAELVELIDAAKEWRAVNGGQLTVPVHAFIVVSMRLARAVDAYLKANGATDD